jgi:hypothetical protein
MANNTVLVDIKKYMQFNSQLYHVDSLRVMYSGRYTKIATYIAKIWRVANSHDLRRMPAYSSATLPI